MLDFIKKIIFYLWNPKKHLIRDSKGKVIDDFSRRKHSKDINKKLASGAIKKHGYHGTTIPYKKGDSPKCYKVLTKGTIVLSGQEPE
jgi:hypothetical protein